MSEKQLVSVQLSTKTQPTPMIFLVLDKTRYQRNAVVQALAARLGRHAPAASLARGLSSPRSFRTFPSKCGLQLTKPCCLRCADAVEIPGRAYASQ